MPLNFTAIDFETANQYAESPCAVGLVRVRDGKLVDSLALTFTPPGEFNWFSPFNIKVHGITPADVAGGPTWADALPQMLEFIGDDLLVAHNAPFDMGVLVKAAAAIEHPLPNLAYACSVLMSRKTYNLESYRLNAVAYRIGHEEFNHHDALADSDACARIVVHMAKTHGAETIDELLDATKQKRKQLF